jgi:iron complex transport system ATP-binding protein
VLELDNVGFAYRRGAWVFRGFSVSVRSGGILALLGPNGAGKSTLLRCAAGLIRPQEGQVRRSGPVGFVPQLHGVSLTYSAFEIVLMGRTRLLKAYESPGRSDLRAARLALERVGAGDLAERPFSSLSGGERQLVLVARAVAGDNEILVLDEPVSSLDLRNEKRILSLVRDLAADGHGVLLSLHLPDHALQVADETAVLFGGGEALVGPTERLLGDGLLERLYGVRVRMIAFEEDGATRQAVVTW